MKRALRISNLKDYIAIDIIDESKNEKPIVSTCLYLPKNKPVEALWRDHEKAIWYKCLLIYTGETITCKDVDVTSDFFGMTENNLNINDLLDEAEFQYIGTQKQS